MLKLAGPRMLHHEIQSVVNPKACHRNASKYYYSYFSFIKKIQTADLIIAEDGMNTAVQYG
jgi:hypothetical protein